MSDFEARTLARPGAAERVARIEAGMRVAVGLVALRTRAGLTQSDVAERMGRTRAEVANIETSGDPALSSVAAYVTAVGADLSIVAVLADGTRVPLTEEPSR